MKTIVKESLANEEKEKYNASFPTSLKSRLATFSRLKSAELDADISMNDIIVSVLDSNIPTLEELRSKSVA